MSEQVRQDLEGAMSILEEHGWCQGSAAQPDGKVCAVGAVWSSVMGHDWMMDQFDTYAPIRRAPSEHERRRFNDCCSALTEHMPPPEFHWHHGLTWFNAVPYFNDKIADDAEQVKDLFRLAIKDQQK